MTTQEAYDLGATAFENGKSSTPCLDAGLMRRLPSNGVLPFLDAWVCGWHQANTASSSRSEDEYVVGPQGD